MPSIAKDMQSLTAWASFHICHPAEVSANPSVCDVRQAFEFDVVQIDALDIPAAAIRPQRDTNARISPRIEFENGSHFIKTAKVFSIIRTI